jgi:outer membrane protein TolC
VEEINMFEAGRSWMTVFVLFVAVGGEIAVGRGGRAWGQEELPHPAAVGGTLSPAPLAAPPAPVAIGARPLPINLPTALRLGNARNLDIVLAARRAQVAVAQLQSKQVLWLPTLMMGTDYYRHDGQLQDIVGNVFGTSKQGFLLGAPSPYMVFSFSDAIFAPLASRQVLRAREAGLQASTNDALLAITQAYFNVQQARGQVAGFLDAQARTEDLLRRVEKLAPGLVPGLEVTRTRTLVAQQQEVLLQYENNWRNASAELVRVLHLDPAVVVQPMEPPHFQIALLALDKPIPDLLEVALTHRPELAAQQALVQAAIQQMRQEKARPLLPSLYVRGFSTPATGTLGNGLFGGGLNGSLNNFSWRQDWDVQLLWQLQGLGLGNRALIRQRGAEKGAAQAELLREQDRVASEVVQAYALAQTAAGRVGRAETEVKQARELVEQSLLALGQTRGVGNLIVLLVRPQEVVAAIQMLQQSYATYFAAVADLNRAQFQLYRALGNPAQALLDDPRCGQPTPPPP